MKILMSILLILATIGVNAQNLNKKMMDNSRGKEVMINICTRESLVDFPEFKMSYEPNYGSYAPKTAIISAIKDHAKGVHITIVMGTWCGDSKLQVPHFYKILDAAGIDPKAIELICVDGSKHAENGIIDNMNIQRVPTFIFKDEKGNEMGRIVERPTVSLEDDMLAILAKK